jgi:hypothetical protein
VSSVSTPLTINVIGNLAGGEMVSPARRTAIVGAICTSTGERASNPAAWIKFGTAAANVVFAHNLRP